MAYTIEDMSIELSKLGYPANAKKAAIEVTSRLMLNLREDERGIVFWQLVHRFALMLSPWWREFFRSDVCFGTIVGAWNEKV